MADEDARKEGDSEEGWMGMTQCLSELMDECVRRGMVRPYIITAISRNGSIMSIRAAGDGSDPEVLAEHFEPEGFAVPVNTMVIDQTDQVVWVTFETRQITYH